MQEKFLTRVARRYLELSEEQASVCLVFPNRRASVFFRQELLVVNPKAQWMPEIFSADDFVREIIRKPILDQVSRLFEFYSVYANSAGPEAEPFDTYMTWAPQLLHDYEEADLYNVPIQQLYGSVDAAYAMKNWSPDGQVITSTQMQYIRFWSRMGEWYTLFREHLTKKGVLTAGMAYRKLANSISELHESMPWDRIVFAGFNALNASEQQYMRFLEKIGKAEILWDTDPYYLDDKLNEAGYFFRKYQKEWGLPGFKNSEKMLNHPDQEIEIIGVAKNLGQALVAGSVLKKLIDTGHDLTDTAVVLCDEKLLMPVLEMLPAEVPAVNITMGYPLHQLPLSGLFQIVFDLHRKSRKSKRSSRSSFYFRDLQKLFRHPDIRNLIGSEASASLLKLVNTERYIYLSASTLLSHTPALNVLDFLFDAWEDSVDTALNRLLQLGEVLFKFYQNGFSEIGYPLETIHILKTLLTRIQQWNSDYPGYASVRTLQKIFMQMLRQMTLPFYGEPLQGLQLMGLLETRNLDFKQLILLSVNESIMPAARVQKSFIPTDIAAHFGMPTYKERDAIYGYHFYRMLQRASKVWLIYNTENDEFGKGEQSRFITQISKEFDRPKINHQIIVPDLPSVSDKTIRIEKTPEIIEQILEKYSGGAYKTLSPSAMQKFVSCSLQYFFTYFSKVKQKDEREEDLENNQIGVISHAVLENLYKSFQGELLLPQYLSKMLEELPLVLRNEFLKFMEPEDIQQGNNLLVYTGIEQMLRNYLLAEKAALEDRAPLGVLTRLLALEVEVGFSIEVKVGSGMHTVHLGGKADRVDQVGEYIRLIDYKTGKVETKDLKLNELNDIVLKPETEKIRQLLFYRLAWNKRDNRVPILPGIIPLKRPSEGVMLISLSSGDPLEMLPQEEIESAFNALVHRILDPSEAFTQTDDLKQCAYCTFKEVCNR